MDAINDAMKLRLTEIRLNNLDRRNKKLVDIVASYVMNNMDYFFNKEEKIKQIRILPEPVREKLLRLLENQKCYKPEDVKMSDFEIRFRALDTLLHDRIKKVDVSELMDFCPSGEQFQIEKTTKVLRIIAERAPKIESLSMNNYAHRLNLLSGDEFFDALGKLQGLTQLEMRHHEMHLNDLQNLCREKLKNLQYLVVGHLRTDDYSSDLACVEEFKRSFSNLRAFIFSSVRWDEGKGNGLSSGQIYRLGLLHLPNLKIIHNYATNPEYEDVDLRITELPSQPSPLLHLRTTPTTLGLHLAYPEITDLMIDWAEWTHDEREVNAMLQFPKIEGLNLKNIPSSDLFGRFLNNYGANLKSLLLIDTEFYGIKVQFSTILDSCPNLEELILRDMDVIHPPGPITNFAKLKILELELLTRNACLSKILAAPQLETFVMHGVDYDVDDLELVSSQISTGHILRNLKTFEFIGDGFRVPRNLKKPRNARFVRFFLALSSFIKNASAYLPNLIDVCQGAQIFYDSPVEGSNKECSKAIFYNKDDAATMEHICGDKTLFVNFFAEFNRRNYFAISSTPAKYDSSNDCSKFSKINLHFQDVG